MQITCPACSTKYEISTQALGEVGRSVRCKRCGHKWFQTPDSDDPAAALPAEPDPAEALADPTPRARQAAWADNFEARQSVDFSQPDETEAPDAFGADPDAEDWPPEPPPRRRGGWLGWGLLTGCVACLVAAFLLLRSEFVSAWPPALRLYDAVGVPVELPGAGLEIRNVEAASSVESGERVLVLEGQIHNVSQEPRTVPEILAQALHGGAETDRWEVPPTPTRLLPGEIATFYSYRRNPGEVSEIVVTFRHG